MAQSRKDYVAAAQIVATHYGAAAAPHERRCSFSPVSGSECNCGKQELISQAEAIREAFVAFFRQAGGRFDADRFREACKDVSHIGKKVA